MIEWLACTKNGRLVATIIFPLLVTTVFGLIFDSANVDKFFSTFALSCLLLFLFLMIWTRCRIWTPYFGHSAEANLNRIRQMPIDQQIYIQGEIEVWVKDMVGFFSFHKVNQYRYLFLRKKDAMLFKITWG